MKIMEIFKEEKKSPIKKGKDKKLEKNNESLKETQGNKGKKIKLVKQTVQDLNTEIEVIKKHKLREFWIWKIWVNEQKLWRQV